MDGPKDPWPRVLSLPEWFVGDPASLTRDKTFFCQFCCDGKPITMATLVSRIVSAYLSSITSLILSLNIALIHENIWSHGVWLVGMISTIMSLLYSFANSVAMGNQLPWQPIKGLPFVSLLVSA